jgi:hypothetical protein
VRCIDDYLRGVRYPLDVVKQLVHEALPGNGAGHAGRAHSAIQRL